MANNSLRPPWIATPATRNIAKRARALRIMRLKGVVPLTKRQARKLIAEHVAPRPPGFEPAPPYPGVRPGGIADRAMQMRDRKPR